MNSQDSLSPSIYLPASLFTKTSVTQTRWLLSGNREQLSPPPPPSQPSDLLPLFATGASATCSLMIHLLHKCNYITTLISDGHRPMPRDASFPNIARKKDHTPRSRSVIKMNDLQVQYFLKLQRRLADILEHQVWPLQRATSPCLLERVMGGIYTLGHVFCLI